MSILLKNFKVEMKIEKLWHSKNRGKKRIIINNPFFLVFFFTNVFIFSYFISGTNGNEPLELSHSGKQVPSINSEVDQSIQPNSSFKEESIDTKSSNENYLQQETDENKENLNDTPNYKEINIQNLQVAISNDYIKKAFMALMNKLKDKPEYQNVIVMNKKSYNYFKKLEWLKRQELPPVMSLKTEKIKNSMYLLQEEMLILEQFLLLHVYMVLLQSHINLFDKLNYILDIMGLDIIRKDNNFEKIGAETSNLQPSFGMVDTTTSKSTHHNVLSINPDIMENDTSSNEALFTINLGLEPLFYGGTNPFIKGFVLSIIIAALDYKRFFEDGVTEYYSWWDIIGSTEEEARRKVDKICDVSVSSPFLKDKKLFHFERKRKYRMTGKFKLFCDFFDRIVQAIFTTTEIHRQTLAELQIWSDMNTAPQALKNILKLDFCSKTTSCGDSEAINNFLKNNNDFDEEKIEALKKAWKFFDAVGSSTSFDSNEMGVILTNPYDYSDVLEKMFWYDVRPFKRPRNLNVSFWSNFKNSGKDRLAKFFLRSKNTWKNDFDTQKKNIFRELRIKNEKQLSVSDVMMIRINLLQNNKSKSLSKNLGAKYFTGKFLNEKLLQNIKEKALLHLFFLVPTIPHFASRITPFEWIELTMGFLLKKEINFRLMFLIRGKLVNTFRDVFQQNSLFFMYILIYHYLSVTDYPCDLDDSRKRINSTPAVVKFLQTSNLFALNTLKKIVRNVKMSLFKDKKFKKALSYVDQFISNDVYEKSIKALEFIVHSVATIETNQNSYFFDIHAKGSMEKLDQIIKNWSNFGFPKPKEVNAKNEEITNIRLDKNLNDIPLPDLESWNEKLAKNVLDDLNTWLNNPKNKVLKHTKSALYAVVQDSKIKLEKNLKTTLFFGSMIKDTKQTTNIGIKILKGLRNFGRAILRKGIRENEHAVWVGVKLNIDMIINVCGKLHDLWLSIPNSSARYFLSDAFLQRLFERFEPQLKNAKRVSSRASVNNGFILIDPNYGIYSDEAKEVEFQASMFSYFGKQILRLLFSLVNVNLQNKKNLYDMDTNFKKHSSINKLNDPNFVNNWRIVLKSDVGLHFFDNIIPKEMKTSLKCIKYGKATWFSYMMLAASFINNKMGNKHLAAVLQAQSPFLGNMINDYEEERKKSRVSEIFSWLSIGSGALYAVLTLNQMNAINTIPTKTDDIPNPNGFIVNGHPIHWVDANNNPAQVIMPDTKSSILASVFNVAKIGIFASIAPMCWFAMTPILIYSILRSQFKIIMRMEMMILSSIKNIFNKFTNSKFMKKLKNFWSFHNKIKSKIEQESKDVKEKHKGEEGFDFIQVNILNRVHGSMSAEPESVTCQRVVGNPLNKDTNTTPQNKEEQSTSHSNFFNGLVYSFNPTENT